MHSMIPGPNRLDGVTGSGTGVPYANLSVGAGGYDALGNITAIDKDATAYDLTYGDAGNPILPTSITKGTSADVDFAYDHNGARIARIDNASSEPQAQYYLPAGTENLAQFDRFGRIQRAYIFGAGERLGFKKKKYEARYIKNHLGSTKLVVAANVLSFGEAVLTAAMDTDPYGNPWRDMNANEGETDPHGFTGQEREDDLDMMYYGARFYMPELGRFLQGDPAREFANPYSYVGNNPVRMVDPAGESEREYRDAVLSDHIYDPSQSLPPGLRMVSGDELKTLGLGDLSLEDESGFFSALYIDEGRDEYIYVFRGTEADSLAHAVPDWSTNGMNALGFSTSQYILAATNTGRIRDAMEANGKTFSLAGHSLGGGLASFASIVNQVHASTYNAAGLNPILMASLDPLGSYSKRGPLVAAFYVRGEILSGAQDNLLYGFLSASGERVELLPQPVLSRRPGIGTMITNGLPMVVAAKKTRMGLRLHGMAEVLKYRAQIVAH